MVDPHEESEGSVKEDPCREKISRASARFWKMHGSEEKGDGGKKKPWFLVRDQGEEGYARESGKEGKTRTGETGEWEEK